MRAQASPRTQYRTSAYHASRTDHAIGSDISGGMNQGWESYGRTVTSEPFHQTCALPVVADTDQPSLHSAFGNDACRHFVIAQHRVVEIDAAALEDRIEHAHELPTWRLPHGLDNDTCMTRGAEKDQ